jgi:hypothetical protein
MLLMTKETMWEEKVMIILSLESLLEVNCSWGFKYTIIGDWWGINRTNS